MDKNGYKEIISEQMTEISKLKEILKTVKTMVHDTPNDMQLGKRIRSYFHDEENPETYIYESPDGKTIYRRRFGDYNNREQIWRVTD
mgnify:FL=1